VFEAIFERARNDHRAAFIPYVMAGDPDLPTTESIMHALAGAGADAIELGIPYGDPLADGPTIAAAASRALKRGVTINDVLALVRRFRERGGAPVVLFTYYNPVLQYGIERFARDAAAAGACAAIVPDIALEESADLSATLANAGLDMPLLIAPSTPRERAKRIAEQASGFIYVVSRLGVTGANTAPDTTMLRTQIAMLRGVTEKPLAVGFGISTPAHSAAVAPLADGIIVGSAVIDAYQGLSGDSATKHVAEFAKGLVAAARYAQASA
jgi:tryptophan synthase alpha chain